MEAMVKKRRQRSFDVSVVIPNFNGESLLKNNLSSVLRAQRIKKNKIKEIIVVDDASEDKSVRLIKREFPEVKLIRHRINRGFSATVNTGARSAKGDFLALLNVDVIPDKKFLENVIPHFKDKTVFAVSFHERGYGWARGFFKDGFIVHEPGSESRRKRRTFWVSGGSGVFRRSYWMKLRGMDEKLFKFYWEDVDLSFRAAKRGYSLLWEPKAKVIHKHESITAVRFSRRELSRMQEVNQLKFIWKNLTSPNLFKKHLAGLTRRVSRHPGYVKIVLLALGDIRLIIKARKKEKKEAKVSDEAIFARF